MATRALRQGSAALHRCRVLTSDSPNQVDRQSPGKAGTPHSASDCHWRAAKAGIGIHAPPPIAASIMVLQRQFLGSYSGGVRFVTHAGPKRTIDGYARRQPHSTKTPWISYPLSKNNSSVGFSYAQALKALLGNRHLHPSNWYVFVLIHQSVTQTIAGTKYALNTHHKSN